MIFDKFKKLLRRNYYPLNEIRISRKTLIKNYKNLCLINKNIRVAPVLKSNAYGLGIIEAAKILEPFEPPFFCVDSIYEAYKLYKARVKTAVLIMGYVDPKNLSLKRLPFSYAVSDLNQFNSILKNQPQAKIHIFVDTGMHREGLPLDDLKRFADNIQEGQKKSIEGLMSHFAASEEPDNDKTKNQVRDFKKATEILAASGIFPRWKHIANSSGLLNSRKLHLEKVSNLGRAGIALYDSTVKFVTHICQVKSIKKGDAVGYNFTYTAKKDSTIAVLPVGYNDGVDRSLSNLGKIKLHGLTRSIIGRVSMNITVVDVTGIKDARVGDEVEMLFNQPVGGRISYEFFVHLNPETKRVVV